MVDAEYRPDRAWAFGNGSAKETSGRCGREQPLSRNGRNGRGKLVLYRPAVGARHHAFGISPT